jgi:antitoxin ParD1/3/4
MRVSLRPDLERFIEEKVRSGQYVNVDAAVNDAVELLREQDEQEELSPEDARKLEELRRELQIGIDQADRGEFVEFTAEDIIREGEAELRRRRGEGNAQ